MKLSYIISQADEKPYDILRGRISALQSQIFPLSLHSNHYRYHSRHRFDLHSDQICTRKLIIVSFRSSQFTCIYSRNMKLIKEQLQIQKTFPCIRIAVFPLIEGRVLLFPGPRLSKKSTFQIVISCSPLERTRSSAKWVFSPFLLSSQ